MYQFKSQTIQFKTTKLSVIMLIIIMSSGYCAKIRIFYELSFFSYALELTLDSVLYENWESRQGI